MKKNQKSAGEAVVEALDAEQVEFVFGLTGTHVMPIYDALVEKPQIRHVVVKHECNAAYMAGMYGFLTGRPGVVLVTAGPGATNSISGVAQAYASSCPMVHISGGVPLGSGNESFHGVDRDDFLHHMFGGITKWSVRVERVEDIPGILSKAFALAVSGRPGPVHIDIPVNIAKCQATDVSPYERSTVEQISPTEGQIELVRQALMSASKPMICAGRGVMVDRAEAELAALADALVAPVVCSIYGAGAIADDHPLAVGTFDEWRGNPFAWKLLDQSDLLLVIGMRSDTLMTKKLAEHMPKKTILVALDDAHTLRHVDGASDVLACNAQLLLSQLLENVEDFRRPLDSDLQSLIFEHKQAFRKGLKATLARFQNDQPLNFGLVMQELVEHLDEDAIVVAGVGNHNFWGRALVPVRGRESFISEGSWGTMGSELAGGIAAKLVYPDRQVVVITGDGSLLMAASDLITAVENKANFLVAVLNDSRYGIINLLQKRDYGRSYGDEIGWIDFARLAGSFGAAGLRLEAPGILSKTVARAITRSASQPVVLDVVCSHKFGRPNRQAILEAGLA